MGFFIFNLSLLFYNGQSKKFINFNGKFIFLTQKMVKVLTSLHGRRNHYFRLVLMGISCKGNGQWWWGFILPPKLESLLQVKRVELYKWPVSSKNFTFKVMVTAKSKTWEKLLLILALIKVCGTPVIRTTAGSMLNGCSNLYIKFFEWNKLFNNFQQVGYTVQWI